MRQRQDNLLVASAFRRKSCRQLYTHKAMNALTRLIIAAIMATASMLALPETASACTCGVFRTSFSAAEYRQWLADFDGVVFRGTVVSEPRMVTAGRISMADYTFKVERVWKGVTTSEVVIRTAADEGMCGIRFEKGRAYLIAADPPPQPATNMCSTGQMHTRNEKDFLSALGNGSPPPK